jgi:heterodisulfide reductase subunit A
MICFLCRCHGENDDPETGIGVDLDQVKKKLAAAHPEMIRIEVTDCLCRDQGMAQLAGLIRGTRASKVLICACSDLLRVDTILSGLKNQGMDAMVEMVDIREGCAWIHGQNRAAATQKAFCLARMAVVALSRRQPPAPLDLPAHLSVLVVGAGPAGLSAAAALAGSGVPVHLVEKTSQLGGMLAQVHGVGPDHRTPEDYLSAGLTAVKNNPLISAYLSASLKSIEGDAGAFCAELATDKGDIRVRTGAVILAPGARAVLPLGRYRYGELAGVISALELEQTFIDNHMVRGPVVFIQCVGFMDRDRPYCSAICCPVTLKQAVRIKNADPDARVSVLYREMMCPGVELEDAYRRARGLGIIFIRFDADSPPVLSGDREVEQVLCRDPASGKDIRIPAKTVVLSTGLEPHPDIVQAFGSITPGTGPREFFAAKPFMNPVETEVPGVFVCGSARWPVSADQAMVQGEAAAMRALALLSGWRSHLSAGNRFQASGFARVDEKGCSGCGNCVSACPFEACGRVPEETGFRIWVNPIRCKACGTCVSVCPNGSIQLPDQPSRAVLDMISVAFGSAVPV